MTLKKGSLKVKLAILMVLLIPLFFGFRVNYLIPLTIHFTFWDILLVLFGSLILLILGYFIIIQAYDKKDLESMKSHEVVNGFLAHEYTSFLITFSVTMIMEELIFRFYILGLLDLFLDFDIAILLGSVIFSLYHIHVWFAFRSYRILGSYLIFAFLLGLLTGFVYFKLGLMVCILIHFGIVLIIYWKMARNIYAL